jgi:hypothetical protein
MMTKKERYLEFEQRACVCRICKEPYVGRGALCDKPECRQAAGAVIVASTPERVEPKRARTDWRELDSQKEG